MDVNEIVGLTFARMFSYPCVENSSQQHLMSKYMDAALYNRISVFKLCMYRIGSESPKFPEMLLQEVKGNLQKPYILILEIVNNPKTAPEASTGTLFW